MLEGIMPTMEVGGNQHGGLGNWDGARHERNYAAS